MFNRNFYEWSLDKKWRNDNTINESVLFKCLLWNILYLRPVYNLAIYVFNLITIKINSFRSLFVKKPMCTLNSNEIEARMFSKAQLAFNCYIIRAFRISNLNICDFFDGKF